MGSDSDGDDYESLATLLTVAIAPFAKHKIHTIRTCRGRGQPAAVCDMSLLMHEIDRSKGEDNPPRAKRTWRVLPRPTHKASSACALRCSGVANSWEYVVERSPLLITFREAFVKKQYVNSGFIIRVVDPILPV